MSHVSPEFSPIFLEFLEKTFGLISFARYTRGGGASLVLSTSKSRLQVALSWVFYTYELKL